MQNHARVEESASGHVAEQGENERLPSAFRGDVSLVGSVTTPDGALVHDAVVFVHPASLTPLTDRHESPFTTRTDPDGRFRFEHLPTCGLYRVLAAKTGHAVSQPLAVFLGESPVAGGATVTREVHITLSNVVFARIAFVDAGGSPVRVQGLLLPFSASGLLFTSMAPTPEAYRAMRLLGIQPNLEENEILFVRTTNKAATHPIRMNWKPFVPGFQECTEVLHEFGLARWPDAQTVRLSRTEDGATVSFFVEFPPTFEDYPYDRLGQLADLRLVVRTRLNGEDHRRVLTRAIHGFSADRGAPFRLSTTYGLDIEYEIVETQRATIVRPQYPSLGYLDVNYSIPEGATPQGIYLRLQGSLGPYVAPNVLWPGRVLFGPLPEGRYTVIRRWGDLDDPDGPSDVMGPFQVKGGRNDFTWK